MRAMVALLVSVMMNVASLELVVLPVHQATRRTAMKTIDFLLFVP